MLPEQRGTSNRNNYLFIGFAIPDEEIKKTYADDKSPQVQNHKFVWNLIKGLTAAGDDDFTYISARPVSDYPYYSKKIIKSAEWDVEIVSKRISIQEIPFINTSILKIVTRFFTGLYYSLLRFQKKHPKNGIIVYTVHVPFMLTGFILSRIYGVELIGVWPDPPSVITNREPRLKRALRGIELRLSKWLMRRFSKVIVLTRYLAEDFAPGKPYLVIEGIIDEKDSEPLKMSTGKYNFDNGITKLVYTGTLKEEYGIKNIVDAVLLMDNNKLVFEIYGSGDYEEEIIKLSHLNRNIKFMGWVPNEVALKAQRDADFLINARSPEDEYVKYSFPSKTLEYMLSGTPLITTFLPGIPDEYRKFIIEMKDNKTKTIYETLKKIASMGKKEKEEMELRAVEFAKTKNYLKQGERICQFLDQGGDVL